MIGPSVGGSRQQPYLGRMPLRRCLSRLEEDNVVLIDEESDSCDNVVVIDSPECLPTKLGGGSERLRRGKKPASSWTSVICLDDDDDDEDMGGHFDGDRVKNLGTFKNVSSSSRKSNPSTSGNFGSSSFSKIDQFGQENISPLKLSKGKRTYSGKAPAGNRFGLDDIDDLSCDDVLDCELMEDSGGRVKELWEKASSKRKWDQRNGRPAQGDSYKDTYDAHKNVETSTDCGQCKEPPSVPKQAADEGEASSIHKKKGNLHYTSIDSLDATLDGVECIFLDTIVKSRASYGKDDTYYTQGSSFDVAECYGGHFSEPSSSTNKRSTEDQNLKGPSSFPCVGEDTEQVNDVHKPLHDDAKDPLGDPCISHFGTCAKENVFVSKVNLSQKEPPTSVYNNQSVYSEFGHVRFSSPEQNGRFPENTNRRTNNAPQMKLSPQPESFSNTMPSHQHTASVCTRYGSKDRPVSGKTVFDKSSVCIDEMCIHKDCCRFGMEQLKERASIFHSVQNEEHSTNIPNPQDNETNDSMHGEDGEALHTDEFLMVGDREKLKETDEYKKATEEEWTSRQLALQIQAEEARNQRRLLKRVRAETMRILDVEKRQKQRLEEIRESEKKDQENSNLREIMRAEIRKDLNKLEVTCYDMASLLRGLGISIGGGSLPPLLSEVRAAYKRALLAFHPDRSSRSDVRKQVEAEEKFKLICRMKEKYLPS